VLAHRSTDFGFRSDHAVMAGGAAAGLLLYPRRLGAAAVVAALLLAFSRVYIAAHYPHDVLAGLGFGAAVTVTGWWLLARPLTALVEWAQRTRLRPLVTATSATGPSAATVR
jgi:membrane-associated phospholipid phosphatase